MRRQVALNYANRISDRVKSVGGIVSTPMCGHAHTKIKRIWVFGSTVKGSEAPNDLDLMIEMEPIGSMRRFGVRGQTSVSYDRRRFKSYGRRWEECSQHQTLVWLTKGMKKVSRHVVGIEKIEPDVMVMIYPRNDLKGVK